MVNHKEITFKDHVEGGLSKAHTESFDVVGQVLFWGWLVGNYYASHLTYDIDSQCVLCQILHILEIEEPAQVCHTVRVRRGEMDGTKHGWAACVCHPGWAGRLIRSCCERDVLCWGPALLNFSSCCWEPASWSEVSILERDDADRH